MKSLIPLIILCAPVLTFGQLKTEYDRYDNMTTVSTKTRYVAPRLEFTARLSSKGQSRLIGFHFYSTSRRWRFLDSSNLIFLADDERIELELVWRREGLRRYIGVEETLLYECSPEQLRKIAGAKILEGRLGAVEFKFGSDTRNDLKLLSVANN